MKKTLSYNRRNTLRLLFCKQIFFANTVLETANSQGQVVQSTYCSFVNCSRDNYINYIGIFAEKMSTTYALQKPLTFFSAKIFLVDLYLWSYKG